MRWAWNSDKQSVTNYDSMCLFIGKEQKVPDVGVYNAPKRTGQGIDERIKQIKCIKLVILI